MRHIVVEKRESNGLRIVVICSCKTFAFNMFFFPLARVVKSIALSNLGEGDNLTAYNPASRMRIGP
jgi:hypothetical protein